MLSRILAMGYRHATALSQYTTSRLPTAVWRQMHVSAVTTQQAPSTRDYPTPSTRPNNLNPDTAINHEVMHAELTSPEPGMGIATLRAPTTAEFHLRYQHLGNSAGHMQGGAICTLHDLAACQAITHMGLGGDGMTIHLNFTQPIALAYTRQVQAIAKVIHLSKRHATVSSDVFRDHQFAGTAQLTFNVRPLQNTFPPIDVSGVTKHPYYSGIEEALDAPIRDK